MPLVLYKIYLGYLAIVAFLSFTRLKKATFSTKLIIISLMLTAISELIAYYYAIKHHNSLAVYHIYTPLHFLILAFYFNTTISFFKKKSTGILIGTIGVSFSIINSIFFQKFNIEYNTYFLVLEAFLVIGMVLCFFFDYLDNKKASSNYMQLDFWFNCIFLIFWSFTFFRWLVNIALPSLITEHRIIIQYMMWAINIITYTGFGLVFLFYKKLQNDE